MEASDNDIVGYRVVDTSDAPTYQDRAVKKVLASAEAGKSKYSEAVKARRASFTHFVQLVDDVQGCEGKAFVKRLANQLSILWEKPYVHVINCAQTRLLFATIQATNLCLRKSRMKWRSSTGIENGTGLPFLNIYQVV